MFEGIEGLFSELDRRRGRDYFLRGLVTLDECSERSVIARVRGSIEYHVSLLHTSSGWSVMCTCPAFERESSCKHLYATVLCVRAGAQRAPPFQAAKTRPETRRKTAWSSALERLESLRPGPEEVVPEIAPSLAVRWVLNLDDDPHAAGGHVLETQLARRRADGSVRNWRSGALRASQRNELDEEERALVALAWGLRRGSYDYNDALAEMSRVPPELQANLLRALAGAGRLLVAGLGDDSPAPPAPLALDAGPAWGLALELVRADGALNLRAFVERGSERLALDAELAPLEGGLFVAGDRLSSIDWRGAWPWVGALRQAHALAIPQAQLGRVLDLLTELPRAVPLRAPEFVETLELAPHGALRLYLGRERDAALRAELGFRYGDELVRRGSRTGLVRRGERLLELARSSEREDELAAEFLAAGGRLENRSASATDALVPRAVFPALVRTLHGSGWTIEAEGRPVRVAGEPKLSVSSGIDWFDLEAEVPFGEQRAALPELLRALDAREPLVVLADGSHGLLPERWLASMEFLRDLAQPTGAALRLAQNRAWLLDAWLEGQGEVDTDAAFARASEYFRRAASIAPRREPAAFRGELRAYQREGLGWLHFLSEIGMGGCLADDMGLGKTVQVLALLVERRARARGPALVVAPRSVLFNWLREAQRFAPKLAVVLHHGPGRARRAPPLEDADLVLTSYGTLRRDAALFAKLDLDCAVLDEAQAIKNEDSISAKAARVLRADLRLALTGTPVENHLGELYSIFGFLNPGLVDRGLRDSGVLEKSLDDPEAARLLSRALRPFLLRRTKEAVAPELPARTEQVLSCELEGAERRAYDELREHIRSELLRRVDELGIARAQMNVLESLLRLRQAACHPGLLDERRVSESSAKLEALLPLLEEVRESGHKALVFSQFTSFLAILRQRLDAQGVRYEYLDGKTRKREECVRRFQEDAGVPLFLISLKAGGTGLNLTAADYVFLMDPWWNPAVEAQAIDRTHRIGQTRAVTAYRLVAQDTVEEKVLALQEKKRALVQALFEGGGRGGGATLRDLTREDLEWILG